MKEDSDLIEKLIKRTKELGLAYFELIKLKTIDNTINFISAIFPDLIVGSLIIIFLFFLNLGLALWLGTILGKIYFGFLAISLFYLILGFASHFFMRKWLKKVAVNYFIKQFFRF